MYLLFLAFRVGSQINFEHQLNQEPTNPYRSILGFFGLDQTKTEIFEIFVYRRNFKTRKFSTDLNQELTNQYQLMLLFFDSG